ncbi:hypothetical protein [Candidatus Leptofilum sp.]|uniref:hypothetical protein n=1 Tax=Candidatus Leptofilum sp. TaxID=3241576 RepID=UPI003B5ADDCB
MHKEQKFLNSFPLASSENVQQYALKTPNGTYIKVSTSAHTLLQAADSGLTFAEIATIMSKQQGKHIAVRDVAVAYENLVREIASPTNSSPTRLTGFWFTWTILSELLVNKIGQRLTKAFSLVGAILLLIFTTSALSYFLLQPGAWRFTPSLTSFALLLLAFFFHEVGHATALLSFGGNPGGIGFAAYWIVPVFFSDVTAGWQLPRLERIVVALGGIYFHMIICAAYAMLYLITKWEPLHAAVVAILVSSLFTLLPVFKMDGYWITSDLLGVTNLDRQRVTVLRYFWRKLNGRSAKALPWPMPITIAVLAYTFLSVITASYFLIQGITLRWPHLIAYPSLILDLLQRLTTKVDTLSFAFLEQLIMETYIVLAIIFALFWFVRTGSHLFKRWWFMQQRPNVSRL